MVASKMSQALEDGKISEEEFESLLGMTNTFYDERQKISESLHEDSLKQDNQPLKPNSH